VRIEPIREAAGANDPASEDDDVLWHVAGLGSPEQYGGLLNPTRHVSPALSGLRPATTYHYRLVGVTPTVRRWARTRC
jgi:hypothetical protein